MHIIVFGGTYNPIHNGHITVAKRLIKRYNPDMCLFVVTNDTPGKPTDGDVSATQRLEMVQAAVDADAECAKIIPSDMEIVRGGQSYTYETLEQLHYQYPTARISLTVGSDRLCDMHTWRNPERIFELADVIAIRRQGQCDTANVTNSVNRLERDFGARVFFADFVGPLVSSTAVRQRVFMGLPISEYVPKGTERYIYENMLYQPDYIKRYAAKLKDELSYKRYTHCVSTMRTAISLAFKYNADASKCRIAALLHDCMKLRDANYLELADKFGIIPDEYEQQSPGLLHAKLGAYACKHVYGIDDAEIINAILYHTLCRNDMTDIDKIIYVADKTEALRHYPGVDGLRTAAEHGLNCGVIACMDFSVNAVLSSGKRINPSLQVARDYLAKTGQW